VSGPDVSVVVAAARDPLRLRWLLNALERQSLDDSRWEVVVVHDGSGQGIARLLQGHPLAERGRLRTRLCAPSTLGARLNAALGATSAPLIVLTTDRCRPPEDWLTNLVETARSHPDAIVRGPVLEDPDEGAIRHAAFWHGAEAVCGPVEIPSACNVAFPRELLARLGDFPECFDVGADAVFEAIAGAAGAPAQHESRVVTYHAVEDWSLAQWVADAVSLRGLPLLFKRHPAMRKRLYARMFWKGRHALLPVALAGVVLQRRRPLTALLVLPWAVMVEPRRSGQRGRVRHLTELPGWAVIDAAEIAMLVSGSIEHRSLVL
jgi:hypothetical protein